MSGGRGIGALVLVPIVGAALTAAIPPQTALEVDELAQYRLKRRPSSCGRGRQPIDRDGDACRPRVYSRPAVTREINC